MKNKEKFIDKLADFACTRDNIAMNFKGELVGCYGLLCENCKFCMETDCKAASREWLEKEYIEPPLSISRKDVRLFEYMKDSYKYIARNHNGDLYLYTNKPKKGYSVWISDLEDASIKSFDVEFPMIKWEDKEPWKIEDLKKLKVCENYEQTN